MKTKTQKIRRLSGTVSILAAIALMLMLAPAGWAGGANVSDTIAAAPTTPPTVTAIVPATGQVDNQVSATITGTNFTGSPTVWLGRSAESNISGTEVQVVSETSLTCSFMLTGAALGKWNVKVQTENGTGVLTDGFEVTEQPPPPEPAGPFPIWYLAEGSTAWGFSTYITIENPNTEDLDATVTFMPKGSPVIEKAISLPAESQTTLTESYIKGLLPSNDFSTKVECLDHEVSIAVDRTMTWTGTGAASPEQHSAMGVPSPEQTWYLAEGSSEWGFECWTLVQNPNDQVATATFTYMIENAPSQVVTHTINPNSRDSFSMETDVGKKDSSIKIESDVPIIPERAMYRPKDIRRGGHDSVGTTAPAPSYFLAEGTTGYGFTTYILVQNPNATATDVTLTYLTASGPKVQPVHNMDPNSRWTVRVNDNPDMQNTDFSTQVQAPEGGPIIAERAMYWNNGTGEAFHDSIGLDNLHSDFYLPDGEVSQSQGIETYILIANPGVESASVEISYLLPSGTGNNVTFNDTIAAGTRRTYGLGDKGITGRAATIVRSSNLVPIAVERAMYFHGRSGGTDTIGAWEDPPLVDKLP